MISTFLFLFSCFLSQSCDRFSFVDQVQPLFDQLEIPIDFYLSTPCGISELWLALQVCLIISALVGMCIAIVLNRKGGRVYYDAVAATDAFHARTR